MAIRRCLYRLEHCSIVEQILWTALRNLENRRHIAEGTVQRLLID